MFLKKTLEIIFLLLVFFILFYSYYYLPSKNKGSIKVKTDELAKVNIKDDLSIKEEKKVKNTFFNTEYKNQNEEGQIYTTRAEESYLFQSDPDLIYLIKPFSFTNLKKDNSILEVNSDNGIFDKKNNIIKYENNVIIKNKNYIITSNQATHFSSKNKIIISGDVVMKDLTNNLSHIAYSDIVEINTISNNIVAFMNEKKKG